MRQLRMRLASLTGLPQIDLPTGDALRLACSDDDAGISEVLASAFPEFPWTADKVRGELLDHPEVFATFVIERCGRLVATASCKRVLEDQSLGYLHWCAVHPGARGSRLGRMVCIAALEAFAAEGMSAAILETDDERLPAIRTYLNLSFAPEIRDEDDRVRWADALAALESRRIT